MIVAAIQTKGGVGKSTLIVCLAAEAQRRGVDVAVLDATTQRTTSKWLKTIPGIVIDSAAGHDAVERGIKALSGHQLLLIDTPGYALSKDVVATLAHAHKVLIPMGPSPADALEALEATRLIEQVNQTVDRKKSPISALGVINQAHRGGMVGWTVQQMDQAGLRMLGTVLYRRQPYAEAMARGVSLYGMGSAGRQAADEVAALYTEMKLP